MRKLILLIIAISVAAGIAWAQEGDYNYNPTPDTTQCSPNVDFTPIFFYGSLFSNQTAMNTYSTANAYQNSSWQTGQQAKFVTPNLPSMATYPSIDYQNMTVKMLDQRADFNNYALDEMKKSDEALSKNTWGKDTCPIPATPPLSDKFSPAYNESQSKE